MYVSTGTGAMPCNIPKKEGRTMHKKKADAKKAVKKPVVAMDKAGKGKKRAKKKKVMLY